MSTSSSGRRQEILRRFVCRIKVNLWAEVVCFCRGRLISWSRTLAMVPMILWASETFKVKTGGDQVCLVAKAGEALTDDNLLHSLLGMPNIKTKERIPALDTFATCKAQQRAG